MEIKTEADDVDEGVQKSENRVNSASRWTSPRIRKKLQSVRSFSKNFN